MVGDRGAPVSFVASLHPGVEKWEKMAISNEHLLEIEDPITKQKVDIGIITYVDDIQAKHVINTTNQRTHEPIQKLQKTNWSLDQILGEIAYAQNRSKQESVPVFMGSHTKYNYRHYFAAATCFGLGRVGTDARYLEVRIAAPKENKYELKCMLQAMVIGWGRMG